MLSEVREYIDVEMFYHTAPNHFDLAVVSSLLLRLFAFLQLGLYLGGKEKEGTASGRPSSLSACHKEADVAT